MFKLTAISFITFWEIRREALGLWRKSTDKVKVDPEAVVWENYKDTSSKEVSKEKSENNSTINL